jgi:hypothetical protein
MTDERVFKSFPYKKKSDKHSEHSWPERDSDKWHPHAESLHLIRYQSAAFLLPLKRSEVAAISQTLEQEHKDSDWIVKLILNLSKVLEC